MNLIPDVSSSTSLFMAFLINQIAFWPKFNVRDKKVLQLKNGNITLIPDDFNLDKTNFLNSPEVLNEFEK